MHERVCADHLDNSDLCRDAVRRQAHCLGPHPEQEPLFGKAFDVERTVRGHDVHARRADEAGNERVRGLMPELVGRSDLLDHTGAEHRDAVAEDERLRLIMRDVDHRPADAGVQGQLEGICDRNSASRFDRGLVEQTHRARARARARAQHAAARPRKRAWPAAQLVGAADQLGGRTRPARASRFGTSRTSRPKAMFSSTVRCGKRA